jgi:hypothetical protein
LQTSLDGAPTPPTGWIGEWSPEIGDPTAIGWFTVVAYFLASWLAYRAFRASAGGASVLQTARYSFGRGESPHARVGLIWWAIACMLGFLGVNKQLDLQTALTELAKLAAHAGGWYDDRRSVQLVFIACLVAGALSVLLALAHFGRPALGRLRLAMVGLVLLGLFVCLRAVSFHHVDTLFGTDVHGFRLNWILELSGICVLGIAARRELGPGLPDVPATPATTRR